MEMLILRLRGPLMAFGDVAIDELRPTDVLPTLSQITGMIANALGWTYHDTEKLQRLQDRLSIACRLDRTGSPLRDYQTAQLNSSDLMWRSDGLVAGREGGSSGDFTVQRYRHYRADASVTVLAALSEPEEYPTLRDIRAALRSPARPLFIGRVSCPPSQPVCREPDGREIVMFDSLEEGIRQIPPRGAPVSVAQKLQTTLAEWPLTPEQSVLTAAKDKARVIERFDCRRWTANVHGGRRYACRTMIPIPAGKEEASDAPEHGQP